MSFTDRLELACELQRRGFYPYSILKTPRKFEEFYLKSNSVDYVEFEWIDNNRNDTSIGIKIGQNEHGEGIYCIQ